MPSATADAVFLRDASVVARFNIEATPLASPPGLEFEGHLESQPSTSGNWFRAAGNVAVRYPSGTYVLNVKVPKGIGCGSDGTISFRYTIRGVAVEDADRGVYDVRIHGACDGQERLVPFGKVRLK